MVTEGYKETEIGVIPVEWEVVKLETICDVRDGTHDSPKYQQNGIPFITSKHLTDNGIDFSDVNYISNKDHTNFSKRSLVENGDILFGMIGTIGKPLIVNYDFEFSIKNIALLKFNNNIKLNNFFTLNLLKSTIIYKQFSKLSNGGVQSFIALGMIRSLKIPLPPLKEQEKIADILSTADEKIDAIASQIEKAETLKKGLLQKLLSEGIGHSEFKDSELGKIPESWEVVELPHITDKITSGGTPSRKKAEYFENGTVNWIKTGELRDCYIYNSKEKITEDAVANSSAKVFPVDTLLIAMYGATIGRTAYLKTECSTNQACCAIIFNQSIADPYFYWKYFHFIKDDLISQGRGAGQPNISQSIIKTLLIPLPPLKEQKQIADILSTADEKLEVLRAKKQMYETLKKGLLQKLLSGEVRV